MLGSKAPPLHILEALTPSATNNPMYIYSDRLRRKNPGNLKAQEQIVTDLAVLLSKGARHQPAKEKPMIQQNMAHLQSTLDPALSRLGFSLGSHAAVFPKTKSKGNPVTQLSPHPRSQGPATWKYNDSQQWTYQRHH